MKGIEQMSHIKSASAFYNAANGQRVRKDVSGVATVDQWPAILADAIAQLEAQGAKAGIDYRETETALEYGNRFIMKPKLVASETGIFTVKSAQYAFQPDRLERPIMGDKKGAYVNESGQLIKEYDGGMIVTFTIEGSASQ
jgi:hypothetical protein